MPNTVGEALRFFRLRRGLTLIDVACLSGDEFKVSSLGAYERGDRAITYERLERLAEVYGVDIQTLIRGARQEPEIDLVAYERRGGIVIDLSRFRTQRDTRAGAVMEFGNAIKALRRGSDSSVIVVRRSDAAFLATAMDCDPDAVDDVLMAPTPTTSRSQDHLTDGASRSAGEPGRAALPGVRDAGYASRAPDADLDARVQA